MATRLNPYLSFRDNAREAMTFYQGVFGGNLQVHTFSEYGASQDPAEANKVMHAQLESPNGIVFMAADTPSQMEWNPGQNISMSLSGEDEQELTRYFNELSQGGSVVMPLEKQVWGDRFGMLKDKFGIDWMVNILGH
jgi:PhnB protein